MKELRIVRSNGPHSQTLRAHADYDGVVVRQVDARFKEGDNWVTGFYNALVQVPTDQEDVRVEYFQTDADDWHVELRFGDVLILLPLDVWSRVCQLGAEASDRAIQKIADEVDDMIDDAIGGVAI